MSEQLIAILDVGKTLAKLTLWTPTGELIARRARANERTECSGWLALDTAGIEAWMVEVLSEFATLGRIGAIYPVGHGAAAALVRDGRLVAPPMDYELQLPTATIDRYRELCDPFRLTGSPPLPGGLNLGAQLYWLQTHHPELFAGATILPWPQYWAWRLSGVAACELSSLGCHSDLWQPHARRFSDLAVRQGWAAAMAPLRSARDVLGTLTTEWMKKTGLPDDVAIYCGVHDSNAALVAARGFEPFATDESTVLSTGTWFVAMRTPGPARAAPTALPVGRDCLVNVDVDGNAVPSARFMGGREIETLVGIDARAVDIKPDQPALLEAAPGLIANGIFITPGFAPACGPFPTMRGRWWPTEPADWLARRAAASLYIALMADTALSLIGSRGRLLIEGRFAEAELFVRTLATLRPDTRLYVSHADNDVSFGALRLINPALKPAAALSEVEPLPIDLLAYRARWLRAITTTGAAVS